MPGCISRTESLFANAGRRQTKTLAEVVLRSRLAERKEGAAVSGKEATTMTVRAMGALLGLKKTESYYLVNKKVFDTVMVAGQRRVVKASFEEWYARQDRYRKVDGEPPGAKLHSNMYSVSDLQKMLNLSQDSVLELIHREKFLTMTFEGKFWIPKVIFDDWYASQSRYRKPEDRERDRAAEESSMTIPEMGRLLGLNPRQAWQLYYKHQDELKLIRIADRPRVTNASFLYWISGQEEHKIDSEATLPQIESEDELLTALEAAEKLGVNVQRIYRALRNSKAAGKKVGRTWYFKYMDILTALSKEE